MPDETGFESIPDMDELRERLTRGGLAPEAVEKAIEAFEAGELQSLVFAIGKDDRFNLIVPAELLVKVFPTLAEKPPSAEDYVVYEINRHRYGKKSLTLRWPDGDEPVLKDQEGNVIEGDHEVPSAQPTDKVVDPYTDMVCEEHPDKPWPHDDCLGPGMPPRDDLPEKSRDPRKDPNHEEDPWPEGDKDARTGFRTPA